MEAIKTVLNNFYNSAGPFLGLGVEPKDLSFAQVSLRGIIVLLVSLAIIRFGKKRSLAQRTAFDTGLIVILASVLARAVNGSGPFFATLGGAFVMVCLHRFFGWLACRSHLLGILIKGEPNVIVRDGEIEWPAMRRNHISEHDLLEDMRSSARLEDVGKIRVARVERSGSISFIKKDD